MFGKQVVIVVLVTLVKNASLRVVEDELTLQNKLIVPTESTQLKEEDNPIVDNGNSPKLPERKIIYYLNCSDLHEYSLVEDTIELSDLIIVAAENPCIIKASDVILRNNHFPGYRHAYNITGKRIVITDNEFIGPELNNYIVGDDIRLINNTYQGHLQVHEVAGYQVMAFHNVFDGKYRVHQYAATNIQVFDNESKGSFFDVILKGNTPMNIYDLYPDVLSNCESRIFNDVIPQTEYNIGKMGPETFVVTPYSFNGFLQELKSGSKINRPVDAVIVTKLQELINDHLKIINITQKINRNY